MGNQNAALTADDVSGLAKETSFSSAEIRSFYKRFRHEDHDGSMSLEVDEFKTMYSKIFPKGDASTFAEHVFRTFDTDGNGQIDFHEFIASLSVQQNGSIQQKLEWLFNMYDSDDSGEITKEELAAMVNSMLRLRGGNLDDKERASPEEITNYILKKADRNRDGMLSREEFIQAAIKHDKIQRMVLGPLSVNPLDRKKII